MNVILTEEHTIIREIFRGIRAAGIYYGTITDWEDGIMLGLHDVDKFTRVDKRIMIALSIYINVFTHDEYKKIHAAVKNVLNKYGKGVY
ncbi:hypothetical protein CN610_19755 [Bacillus wiedmannii]|nr:hypothetical protein CN610_19755 [Bacillus wiedmannii]